MIATLFAAAFSQSAWSVEHERILECRAVPATCFITVGAPNHPWVGHYVRRDGKEWRHVRSSFEGTLPPEWNKRAPVDTQGLEIVPLSEFKLFRGCWPVRKLEYWGDNGDIFDFRFGPSGGGSSLAGPPFQGNMPASYLRHGDMRVDVFAWKDHYLVKYRRADWITESVLIRFRSDPETSRPVVELLNNDLSQAFGTRFEATFRDCPKGSWPGIAKAP